MNTYTILVNSCDDFEDCWEPFFALFKKYWPDCNASIVLNTEAKRFTFPGLAIKSSQVNIDKKIKLTWSECLMSALNNISSPLILYFQEDYFLEKPVNSSIVNEFASLMIDDPKIKYIGLTNSTTYQKFNTWTVNDRLWEISNRSRYRISTQCALWRKDTFLSYLRPSENGWMFEVYGTKRSQKRNELFLTASRDYYNSENPIIYYQPTGIIKGKWLNTMPDLFANESLKMDFSIRGIYKEPLPIFRRMETIKKLARNPIKLYSGLRGR